MTSKIIALAGVLLATSPWILPPTGGSDADGTVQTDLDLNGNTITDSLGAAHLCGSGTPGSAGIGDGYCSGGFEVDGVLYADDDLKFTGTEFMDAVSGDFRIFADNNLLYRQTADNPIAGDGLFDISPATTNDSWTASSGTQYGFRLRTDLEQSGTAAFHAFEVAVTDDASGSGQDYLLYLDWGADGVPELAVQDTGAKVGSQVKTGLTDAGSNAFVRLSIAQGAHNTAHISYSIHADDGSDLQARSGLLVLAMVNAGGTEACDVQIAAASEAVAVSAGTLTSAFACASNAADTIDISVTPTSSLTPTTLEIRYSIHLDQDATVTAL